MNILVFEYICGGGLAGQALPDSLLREGRLMLQALLDELTQLPDLQILLPLDARLTDWPQSNSLTIYPVADQCSLQTGLSIFIKQADAFWPVAPESAGELQRLVEWGKSHEVLILASEPSAIAIAADKWLTYQTLQSKGLTCVETRLLSDELPLWSESVIKPRDGVGCVDSWLGHDLYTVLTRFTPPEAYIIQPFCSGQALSLSALFDNGQARLLTVNQQNISVNDARAFQLNGCQVNIATDHWQRYQEVLMAIAQAIPGLWGYIGVDLIETGQGAVIVEINPRLTTSYSAIHAATGINVAAQVINMANQIKPDLRHHCSQTITIEF